MTAIAAGGFARPKSNRWAEGDGLVKLPGLGDVIAHGLAHQYGEWLRGQLRGVTKSDLYSQTTERDVLTAITGGTALSIAGCFLALTTVAVANTDTSASITEVVYTTYARQTISASFAAATGGNPATITTNAAITFPAVGAGGGTIIGYAGCAVSGIAGAGRLNFYGTCTSVVVSTTQTPPTVASGALSVSQT